jgi:hypothetical protein
MLDDWIYGHPTWMFGSLAVVIAVLMAWGGVFCVYRMAPADFRRAHNDVVGYTLQIVGVVYAVLLAFIAIVTWETFSKADGVADNEEIHLANLYADTSALRGDAVAKFRDHLREYVRIVIEEEWPAQRAGRSSRHLYKKGWDVLEEADELLVSYKPADLGDSNAHRSALEELNALLSARRSRVEAASGHVPELVWWIIVMGGALTVAYTFLFGTPSLTMHLLTTGGLAASLALVIVLIVELDYPFRGEISVGDEPFHQIQYRMATHQ